MAPGPSAADYTTFARAGDHSGAACACAGRRHRAEASGVRV